MTLLEQVVQGAIDDSLSTADLLRKMLVLGHRLQSEPLQTWVECELNGYMSVNRTNYPSYRGPLVVPVEVTFAGAFGARLIHEINEATVPRTAVSFRRDNFYAYLHQPVAELETLAKAEGTPSQAWANSAVAQFNQWGREGKAGRVDMYQAFSARKIIAPTLLKGVTDTIRTRALKFALDLQKEFPNAGELGGPTIEIQKVRDAVTYNISNNIFGGNNTVANGENITQNVQINQGDVHSLYEFFDGAGGLDAAGKAELDAAIAADGDKPGSGVAGFLKKLVDGTITLGGAVATPALIAAAKVGLGLFFGVPIP